MQTEFWADTAAAIEEMATVEEQLELSTSGDAADVADLVRAHAAAVEAALAQDDGEAFADLDGEEGIPVAAPGVTWVPNPAPSLTRPAARVPRDWPAPWPTERRSALRRLKEWLRPAVPWETTVVPAEEATWKSATTLAEIGELTARWLEGHLESQPGYYGPVDLDEADGLRDALVRLNRLGLVTDSSQAGTAHGPGYDGEHWAGLAAISAAGDPAQIRALGLRLPDRYVLLAGDARVAVTTRAGQAYTVFGGRDPDLRASHAGLSAAALTALCRAEPFVVYDPVPGRNTLWADLSAAAAPPTAALDPTRTHWVGP